MKFFTAVMACYLVFLSVYPCKERQVDTYSGKTEVMVSANTHSHQDNPYKSDACTPFCSCSRCPASAFFQPMTPFSVLKMEKGITYLILDFAFVSHEDKSIWQPPQLS